MSDPRTPRLPELPGLPGVTFRRARIPEDYDPIAGLLRAANAADGVEEHITAELLANEWEHIDGFDAERDVLVAESGGRVIGYVEGQVRRRDTALALESWGAVLPERRRQGIGTVLHRAIRDHLAVLAAADPRPGTREFRSFTLDAERTDRALLEAEGYVTIRFGFEMRRPLTGALPEARVPDGFEVGPATEATLLAILEADDEAFRDHWGHRPMTEADVERVRTQPDLDLGLWRVAWAGDEVAGSVRNLVPVAENAALDLRRGWLEHVSVRRPYRGRGLARALCAASFVVLRDAGMDEAWLGVDAANPTGALRLYEGLGFHVARRWFAHARPLDGPARPGWRSVGLEAGALEQGGGIDG